jgi:CheY-like chemotaxis protein/glycosyltransferase A (GT-A) superfamily protein (DUF2064 family)
VDPVQFIIMAKEPVPGRVNTRLTTVVGGSPGLTEAQAADLARAMLLCVMRRLAARGAVVVAIAPDDGIARVRRTLQQLAPDVPWNRIRWTAQGGGDLGDRIVRAWRGIGGGPAAVFGIDTVDMPASALDDVMASIDAGGFPIGPTPDGGYWVIGGPTCEPEVFRDIDWGSDSVYHHTMSLAAKAGLKTHAVPLWSDVDHPSDLVELGRRLHAGRDETSLSPTDRMAFAALRVAIDACRSDAAEAERTLVRETAHMNDTTMTDLPMTMPTDSVEFDLGDTLILLVDDNLQNLELMQAYLEALPCRIRTAADGVEAVEAIDDECPDLVLLDVMMPRMSGFEVCQKIKSSPVTRDTKVIMVTALHEVGDFERAVECGTDDFITKPINKLELITRVRSQLEHRLLTRQYQQLLALKGRTGLGESMRPEAGSKLDHDEL